MEQWTLHRSLEWDRIQACLWSTWQKGTETEFKEGCFSERGPSIATMKTKLEREKAGGTLLSLKCLQDLIHRRGKIKGGGRLPFGTSLIVQRSVNL